MTCAQKTMHKLFESGNIDKILKVCGKNPNFLDDEGTLLSYAFMYELPVSVIEKMISIGVSVDQLDMDDNSPMFSAIACDNNPDYIKLLLDKGVEVSLSDLEVMCKEAFSKSCYHLVKGLKLKDNGQVIDGNVILFNDLTFFGYACLCSNLLLVKDMLNVETPNMNFLKNAEYRSQLMYNPEIVETLKQNGLMN